MRIIAARLRQMGQALQELAGQVEAGAPHLGVKLPQPDLFSELDEPQPQLFEGIHKALDEAVEDAKIVGPGKPRKTWKRVCCKMQDTAIREAVNAAVEELGLTCVKYNSYRYYRTADRGRIIASALARLTAA